MQPKWIMYRTLLLLRSYYEHKSITPDYETADDLLGKIRKEKEEKIAKGELKADKKDSFIFTKDCEFSEDKLGKHSEGMRHKRHYEQFADGRTKEIDIPFEIPTTWQWCRLGEICDYGKCRNTSVDELNEETWVLDLEDVDA